MRKSLIVYWRSKEEEKKKDIDVGYLFKIHPIDSDRPIK